MARWEASGESAREFAIRVGTSARTLCRWRRELRKAGIAEGPETALSNLIEVRPARTAVADDRFDVRLTDGRCVAVPASFDADALERLLRVLEAAR